jgi:hypothetical protein
MSDLREDPPPEQPPPSPEPEGAPSRPDPLAGDWSEGLPGPVRAHGLPLPARIGERRKQGWAMAPPAVEAPPEQAWTPQAHDAGFAPVVAPETQAWSVQGAEPEAWEGPKEASPWAAPAQATADWDATAPAPSPAEQWSAPATAEATQDWPAPQPDAPRAVDDNEAATLLQPVDDGEAASFLRPAEEAANDAPSGEPVSLLYPPGDLDPALQPVMDPTLQPQADGESVVMLNPYDHPDLLVPVDDDAPPMASGGAAPATTVVSGEHRVAIHTRGGQTRRGSVTDLDLGRPQFPLQPQGGGSTEVVPHAEVKAIFFMLAPGEPPVAPDGGKVRVTFADGRSIEGRRDGSEGPQGFFLVPVDAQKTNTKRIYVARAAVAHLTDL